MAVFQSSKKLIFSTDVLFVSSLYSGYWHGNVEVHSRRSSDDDLVRGIASDVQTLSCIRHENIQLFLGVCHDLHSDYISIVME